MATKAMELKRKIHGRKDVVIGMWCMLGSPTLVEMVGKEKLCDFIIVDLEHSPYYADKVVEFIHAAEWAELIPFVRVPSADTVFIQKVLDAGVRGILLPQIRSAEEVRVAIAATKYQPEGTRGAILRCHGTGYVPHTPHEKWAEKVKELNEEMMVFTLPLETLDAIKNLEEIVSTPGLDCVSLSLVDLAHALGHIEKRDHPEVRKVQDRCIELCNKHNVPMYALPIRPGQFEYWYNKGIRVFTILDSEVFLHGFTDLGKEWAQLR